jgi:hypothetical protein
MWEKLVLFDIRNFFGRLRVSGACVSGYDQVMSSWFSLAVPKVKISGKRIYCLVRDVENKIVVERGAGVLCHTTSQLNLILIRTTHTHS